MKKIIISTILMSLACSQVTFAETNSVPQTSTTSSSFRYLIVPQEVSLMLLNPSPHSIETKVNIRTLIDKNASQINIQSYADSLRNWSENADLTITNVESYLFFEAQIAKTKTTVLVGINKDRNSDVATALTDLNFEKKLSGKDAREQWSQNELIIFLKKNDAKSDSSKMLYTTIEDLGELAKIGIPSEETTNNSDTSQKSKNQALRRLTFIIPEIGLFTLIYSYKPNNKEHNSQKNSKSLKLYNSLDEALEEIFSTTTLSVKSVFTHIKDKK